MIKTYRGRMIAYNIAVFLAIFIFILFIALQGSMYYQMTKQAADCHNDAQNACLYIKEETAATEGSGYYEQHLKKHADELSSQIKKSSTYQTILLDTEGNILSDSTLTRNFDLTSLCEKIKEKQKPVYSLREIDDLSVLVYAAPLQNQETVFGFIVFTIPTASLYSPLWTMSLFFMLGTCLVFPVLFIIIRRYSNHFIEPIVDLTAIARQINEGNYNVSISYPWKDEIGELTDTFNTMIRNINAAIQQLYSERDRLAAVLASLDDGLLALDQEGNVITSNAHIKTFFNVSNPKTIYDFKFQTFLKDIFEDLKNGKEHISIEIDSNDRDLMIIGSPIRDAFFEENYMLVIRNMTAVNRIKQDQQKFVSSVSHELRTPLTTIIGYTDMIIRRQLTENEIVTRSLTTINKEGHRLLRLVDDLLNVNRLDNPEFSIRKTNLDLQILLKDVIEQMKIKSLDKDIDILYKSDLAEMEILGDYDRLQQVFINIIHNAIKYSDPGAIIDVVATSEDEQIAISVRDYGVGIPETEQEKVFSAFYRVEEDRSRSEGEGGAGLGLYLVRQIVLRHDGNIDIQSVAGEGTNITITFPALTRIIQEGLNNA